MPTGLERFVLIYSWPPHLVLQLIIASARALARPHCSSLQDFARYLAAMPAHVKMVVSPKRLGLIKARMLGARSATGDVLVFLDSHCEATQGVCVCVCVCVCQETCIDVTVPCATICAT